MPSALRKYFHCVFEAMRAIGGLAASWTPWGKGLVPEAAIAHLGARKLDHRTDEVKAVAEGGYASLAVLMCHFGSDENIRDIHYALTHSGTLHLSDLSGSLLNQARMMGGANASVPGWNLKNLVVDPDSISSGASVLSLASQESANHAVRIEELTAADAATPDGAPAGTEPDKASAVARGVRPVSGDESSAAVAERFSLQSNDSGEPADDAVHSAEVQVDMDTTSDMPKHEPRTSSALDDHLDSDLVPGTPEESLAGDVAPADSKTPQDYVLVSGLDVKFRSDAEAANCMITMSHALPGSKPDEGCTNVYTEERWRSACEKDIRDAILTGDEGPWESGDHSDNARMIADVTECILGEDVIHKSTVVLGKDPLVIASETRCLLSLAPVSGQWLAQMRLNPAGWASAILTAGLRCALTDVAVSRSALICAAKNVAAVLPRCSLDVGLPPNPTPRCTKRSLLAAIVAFESGPAPSSTCGGPAFDAQFGDESGHQDDSRPRTHHEPRTSEPQSATADTTAVTTNVSHLPVKIPSSTRLHNMGFRTVVVVNDSDPGESDTGGLELGPLSDTYLYSTAMTIKEGILETRPGKRNKNAICGKSCRELYLACLKSDDGPYGENLRAKLKLFPGEDPWHLMLGVSLGLRPRVVLPPPEPKKKSETYGLIQFIRLLASKQEEYKAALKTLGPTSYVLSVSLSGQPRDFGYMRTDGTGGNTKGGFVMARLSLQEGELKDPLKRLLVGTDREIRRDETSVTAQEAMEVLKSVVPTLNDGLADEHKKKPQGSLRHKSSVSVKSKSSTMVENPADDVERHKVHEEREQQDAEIRKKSATAAEESSEKRSAGLNVPRGPPINKAKPVRRAADRPSSSVQLEAGVIDADLWKRLSRVEKRFLDALGITAALRLQSQTVGRAMRELMSVTGNDLRRLKLHRIMVILNICDDCRSNEELRQAVNAHCGHVVLLGKVMAQRVLECRNPDNSDKALSEEDINDSFADLVSRTGNMLARMKPLLVPSATPIVMKGITSNVGVRGDSGDDVAERVHALWEAVQG